MSDCEERELIEAAQKDPLAFGVLYERYVDRIYNYIFHRVGNVCDAEDLTSRTFFRALSHLADYQDQGYPFSAWLYRIAHNLVANWHRDRSRRPMIALDEIVARSLSEQHPEAVTEARVTMRLLREVIRTLDPVRQELLVLKFAEGLSNAEIGEILGRSEGAIKSLYHRTLLQLREEMQKRERGE
ncbi:MAG: sigma-70 family RNA polymerase sigma factor [Chloroflexi bacterium]|nr:sigma-70 family RNA polymerase sigma factor [Chloroflexota bacterium]